MHASQLYAWLLGARHTCRRMRLHSFCTLSIFACFSARVCSRPTLLPRAHNRPLATHRRMSWGFTATPAMVVLQFLVKLANRLTHLHDLLVARLDLLLQLAQLVV